MLVHGHLIKSCGKQLEIGQERNELFFSCRIGRQERQIKFLGAETISLWAIVAIFRRFAFALVVASMAVSIGNAGSVGGGPWEEKENEEEKMEQEVVKVFHQIKSVPYQVQGTRYRYM